MRRSRSFFINQLFLATNQRKKSCFSFHCHGWTFNHHPKTSPLRLGIQNVFHPMHNVKFDNYNYKSETGPWLIPRQGKQEQADAPLESTSRNRGIKDTKRDGQPFHPSRWKVSETPLLKDHCDHRHGSRFLGSKMPRSCPFLSSSLYLPVGSLKNSR